MPSSSYQGSSSRRWVAKKSPRRQYSPEEILQQQVADLRRLLEMKEGVFRNIDEENVRLTEQLRSSRDELQQVAMKHEVAEQQRTEAQERAAVLERDLEQVTREKANVDSYAAKLQMHLADMQQRVQQQQQAVGLAPTAAAKQQQAHGLKAGSFKVAQAGLGGMMAGLSLEASGAAGSGGGSGGSGAGGRRLLHDSAASSRIENALAASSSTALQEEQTEGEEQEGELQQEEGNEQQEGKQQQLQEAAAGSECADDSPKELERQRRLQELKQQQHDSSWAKEEQQAAAHPPSKNGSLMSGWRLWQAVQQPPQEQ